MARRHAHAKPTHKIGNSSPFPRCTSAVAFRTVHGRSRDMWAMCVGDFFAVTSRLTSRVERPRVPRRPSRRPSRAVDRMDPALSLSFFSPARRAGGGRGAARGACENRDARGVLFHCDCLDYNFVRVSVISLQSAPLAARQTTQESAPAGGACSSGTSRCARRSVCLVALRHISWATGSGRVPRARSLIYATPA